ncbi:MAG: hypothetical protein WC707_04675 [Candidatus Babeliaceae bacterium]|jgi:hypothetical protein
MRFKMDFSRLPKCGAQPKKNSSRVHPCRHIALKNGRCYYHQGRPLKHGYYSEIACMERSERRQFINSTRTSLLSLNGLINEKG